MDDPYNYWLRREQDTRDRLRGESEEPKTEEFSDKENIDYVWEEF